MSKLDADDPRAGTIDDPNVEDPYADLRARNEAARAAVEKKPTWTAKVKNTETSTAPKRGGGKK